MTLPDLAEGAVPEIPADTGSARRTGWVTWSVLATLLVAVAALGLFFVLRSGSDSPGGHTIRYLVPAGTGARIDAGEEVVIIPSQLTIKVGDTLVIINEDSREHSVAGYQVRAGDTLSVSYPRPGLYMNSCSVNTTSELVYITVVA